MFNVTGKGITTKDPELRSTTSGKPVCNCTLVNHETYNEKEIAHFTNVVMFGDVAENFANEVEKGCLIEINQGILKHPVRERSDGSKMYLTEVVVLDYTLERNFTEERSSERKNPPKKKGLYGDEDDCPPKGKKAPAKKGGYKK